MADGQHHGKDDFIKKDLSGSTQMFKYEGVCCHVGSDPRTLDQELSHVCGHFGSDTRPLNQDLRDITKKGMGDII